MGGETNLATLLRKSQPELLESAFVFCSLDARTAGQFTNDAWGLFREEEGITLILREDLACAQRLSYDSRWALIRLTVHSALTAVGFLAVLSSALAAEGISLNVVSGYFHDHLFVPWSERQRALSVLEDLSRARS
jgi:uncharacterized protein